MVSHDLREAMNATAAEVGPEVNEFDLAPITPAPCRAIPAPRVLESPVCFECRHFQTVGLPNDAGAMGDFLVIGRVVGIHVEDRFIRDGRVDTAAMKLVARLGYSEYATIDTAWRMRRPG
jgi:flavin reductase (DIM6/NTAB) family NADH-FMN oxidoreductase RutF